MYVMGTYIDSAQGSRVGAQGFGFGRLGFVSCPVVWDKFFARSATGMSRDIHHVILPVQDYSNSLHMASAQNIHK